MKHNRPAILVLVLTAAVVAVCSGVIAQVVAAGPQLVPTPKVLAVEPGLMPLTAASRIMASDAELMPLAALLADEIQAITGLRLKTGQGRPGRGDIGLKINPSLRSDADILAVQKQKTGATRDFAHTIAVGDAAMIEGWDYRATAEGTATMLQAITGKPGQYSLPHMKVKDWPAVDYTGVVVDVARQRIPVDSLKAVVEACRLWKIRYCQLHLTDDEAFTFPSTAFPRLGSKNEAMHGGVVPEVYSLQVLRDLVAFADARGVTLVPELSTPGHSKAMARAMPEVFGGPKIMDITNDEMYKSLDILVGEMCAVFKSSPFFHIGGEDAYLFEIVELQKTKDYLLKTGMKNIEEVMVQHAMRMNTMVRKYGKTTLAWENTASGAEGRSWALPPPAKDEIILMTWIPYPTAEALQNQGFTTITVPWDTGALSAWNIYACNGCNLDPARHRVLGAAQTMWHMSASALVGDHLGGDLNGSSTEGYINSLCDRAERTWEPARKVDEQEYKARLAATRSLMNRLLFPVRIDGAPVAYPSWPVLGRKYCSGPVEIKLTAVGGANAGEIRYTIDGSEPTPQSPVFAAPFTVETTTAVNAALFCAGRQSGRISRAVFDIAPGDGAIDRWLVSGPYVQAGKKFSELFDVSFPPETGAGEWKPLTAAHVKFSDLAGFGGDDRVAYMKTMLFSPKEQKAILLVASDDGVKVFLNGKVVHAANVARPIVSPDSVEVTLKEGWNPLLLKVTNGSSGWEAWVKVRNADGEPMERVRSKAE